MKMCYGVFTKRINEDKSMERIFLMQIKACFWIFMERINEG